MQTNGIVFTDLITEEEKEKKNTINRRDRLVINKSTVHSVIMFILIPPVLPILQMQTHYITQYHFYSSVVLKHVKSSTGDRNLSSDLDDWMRVIYRSTYVWKGF